MTVRVELTKILPIGIEAEFISVESDVDYVFRNTGYSHLAMRNESEENIMITFHSRYFAEELKLEDRKVGVPAGKSKVMGPFIKNAFNNARNDVEFDVDKSGGTVAIFTY